jgi:hypothetical protein
MPVVLTYSVDSNLKPKVAEQCKVQSERMECGCVRESSMFAFRQLNNISKNAYLYSAHKLIFKTTSPLHFTFRLSRLNFSKPSLAYRAPRYGAYSIQ